ncbi:MAG: VOC family protein [Proteobacteria bacterium]|nr:VOC family protein [Pseudomonadota bacterium]
MISAMRSVTIGVSNMDAALQIFHDVMGLAIEQRFQLTAARRAAWGLSPETRGDLVELSCQGYPIGRIRLLALDPRPREYVRLDPLMGGTDGPLDIGVKAVDFYVAAPIDRPLAELTAAGCVARSQPVRHMIGDTESEEVVLFGPDHVPLLIMIGHRHSPRSMRAGSPHGKYSEVPTISVVAGDPAVSRRFYGEALGLTAVVDDETPEPYRDLVCTLTGAPRGTRIHWLLYQDPDEPSGKILLVHFIGREGKRLVGRMHPSRLGVGLFQHSCPDVRGLHTSLVSAGARIEMPPTEVDGQLLLLVRGPNEELFEITSQ